jgi:hypothetical protein
MGSHTVIIGDVHGRADLLQALVTEIGIRLGGDVDLYHVGDLIDRGPDSKAVIQTCIDEGIQGILGNHETWLHKLFATGEFDTFALHRMIEGQPTLRSYGVEPDGLQPEEIAERMLAAVPEAHKRYILSLPITRRVEANGKTYRVIHTGLHNDTADSWLPEAKQLTKRRKTLSIEDALVEVVSDQSPASILWTSNSFKNPNFYEFPDGSIQIIGHSPTPTAEPIVTDHWIAIDCGCGVRRSVLAGLVLGSHDVIRVTQLGLKGVGKTAGGFTDFSM